MAAPTAFPAYLQDGSGNKIFAGHFFKAGALVVPASAALGVFDADVGYRIASAAASGKYLRGDGSNFISADLLLRDALDGAWSTYSPTITAAVGTFTSVSGAGRYLLAGKTLWIAVTIVVTTVGTASSYIICPLPGGMNVSHPTVVAGRETAATGKMCAGTVTGGNLLITFYDNSFPGASGNTVIVSGTIEID